MRHKPQRSRARRPVRGALLIGAGALVTVVLVLLAATLRTAPAPLRASGSATDEWDVFATPAGPRQSNVVDSGLMIEIPTAATTRPRFVAAILANVDDIDPLVVLVYSVRSANACRAVGAVAYRLVVSPFVVDELGVLWERARRKLRSAGWSNVVVAARGVMNQRSTAYNDLVRLHLLCGHDAAVAFRDVVDATPCDAASLLVHPHAFVPPMSRGEPFNICTLLDDSALDLTSSVLERDGSSALNVVLTCGSERLQLGHTPNDSLLRHIDDLFDLRWAVVSPIAGLKWTTASTVLSISCLTRVTATNRLHPVARKLVESMVTLYSNASSEECTDSLSFLNSVEFFVPFAVFDGFNEMLLALQQSDGRMYLDASWGATGDRHCHLERRWLIELYEALAERIRIDHRAPKDQDFTPAQTGDMSGSPPRSVSFGIRGWRATSATLLSNPQLNITTDVLTVAAGDPGASCLATCTALKLGCAPSALSWWFPNSCRALTLLFPHNARLCSAEPNPLIASVAPAVRASDGLMAIRDVRMLSRNATCAASEPNWERVCTCIDAKDAASAQMVPLSDDDVQRFVFDVRAKHAGQNGVAHDVGLLVGHVPNDAVLTDTGDSDGDDDSCPCPRSSPGGSEPLEARCIDYISNYSNVLSLRAMSNAIKFGRTAKLQVEYRHACVQAIVKPPQASFPLEPYAEYVSFEVDRMLSLRYVPLTSWMFVPVSALEVAAQSSSFGHSFAQWMSHEVLMYVVRSNLVTMEPSTGRVVVGCSVQLLVPGVRWQRGTPLNFDDGYLGLLTPERAKSRANGGWTTDDHVSHQILPTNTAKEHADEVLEYLSDSILFDTIIGNDDRGSQKNTHVFRNGSGKYQFVMLDQGKSFYRETVRGRYNLELAKSPSFGQRSTEDGATVCMFHKSLQRRLDSLVGSVRLSQRIKDVVPTTIWKAIGDRRLYWADARLEHIRVHMNQCAALLGEHVAFPWE